MYQFDITIQYLAVQALRVHLGGEQCITFKEGQEANVVQQDAKCTELIVFFAYNAANPETRIKYVDFFKHISGRPTNRTRDGEVIMK